MKGTLVLRLRCKTYKNDFYIYAKDQMLLRLRGVKSPFYCTEHDLN